jgi:hypothetical protein
MKTMNKKGQAISLGDAPSVILVVGLVHASCIFCCLIFEIRVLKHKSYKSKSSVSRSKTKGYVPRIRIYRMIMKLNQTFPNKFFSISVLILRKKAIIHFLCLQVLIIASLRK